MDLSQEMKSNLMEYHEVNSKRSELLLNLEKQFRPILEKAIVDKDVMLVQEIVHTFPESKFGDEAMLEISKLLK